MSGPWMPRDGEGLGALSGLRVLDLSARIAGPWCTKLLADYGADVIKVERPDGGDPARAWGPFPADVPDGERSGLFLHCNTNKRSLTLNWRTREGQEMLRRLAADADLVVEASRPGTLSRYGIGYQQLRRDHPELVHLAISNFGQDGPYRSVDASEITLYAMGGAMQTTGLPDREPLKMAHTVLQFHAGAVAASFAMAALLHAATRGRGQLVDVSLLEVVASSPDRAALNLVCEAYSGSVTFNRSAAPGWSILPTGVYPCADGYVHFNAPLATWWPRFAAMIDRPELASDQRFTANLNDLTLKPEVDAMLLEWTMPRTKAQVQEQAQACAFAGSAVNTMEDLFNDPHFASRGFFVEVDHPEAGRLRYPGAPFRMGDTPWRVGRAPLLGEHTEEVLGALGYDVAALGRLREQGVV
ncbi:MAG: CoA transferase [Chloroflexi bacterium]|nr:MAG: CoA transferase [Chloroflexota bacterium]